MLANIYGRHQARRIALQALYQWSISGDDPEVIEAQYSQYHNIRETRVDLNYFSVLLQGAIASVDMLDTAINSVSTHSTTGLSKIELALLRMSAFELARQPDVPVAVVIDEAIELSKGFGSDNSFRYINAVLDKLAPKFRPKIKAEAEEAGVELVTRK